MTREINEFHGQISTQIKHMYENRLNYILYISLLTMLMGEILISPEFP